MLTRRGEVTVGRAVCAVVAPFHQHVVFFLFKSEHPARKRANLIEGRCRTVQAAKIDIVANCTVAIGLQMSYGVKLDCIILRGQRAQLVSVRKPSF